MAGGAPCLVKGTLAPKESPHYWHRTHVAPLQILRSSHDGESNRQWLPRVGKRNFYGHYSGTCAIDPVDSHLATS
jgi:hypothetical protein